MMQSNFGSPDDSRAGRLLPPCESTNVVRDVPRGDIVNQKSHLLVN